MVFYHGTTTHFGLNIGDTLLPAIETGNLREEWRMKLRDKVFVTPSLLSACKFASKAAAKYGGTAIVYIVEPMPLDECYNVNTNEYIVPSAKIVDVYVPKKRCMLSA